MLCQVCRARGPSRSRVPFPIADTCRRSRCGYRTRTDAVDLEFMQCRCDSVVVVTPFPRLGRGGLEEPAQAADDGVECIAKLGELSR